MEERIGKHIRDAPAAEFQVAVEIAALGGTLEMQAAALDEPVHLQPDAGVDERVEVAAGVLEGEGVRVDQVLGDHEVELRREVEECGAGPEGGSRGGLRLESGADSGFGGGFGGAAETEEGHGGRVYC